MTHFIDLRKKVEPQVKIIYRTVVAPRPWYVEIAKIATVIVIVGTVVWGVSRADDTITTESTTPVVENSAVTASVIEAVDLGSSEASVTADPVSATTSDITTPTQVTPDVSTTTSDTVTTETIDKIDTATTTEATTTDTQVTTDVSTTTPNFFESIFNVVKDTALNMIDVVNSTTTPTIIQQETDTDTGKLVTISATNENSIAPLTDVLASTTIPRIFKVGEENKIHIKWKNNGDQNMSFHASDTDGDGYLDYIEWTVPHLSTQTFEIIFISKAFLLDADQNIVADIYDMVGTQDGNYASVPDGNYVRVTFNSVLDSKKDITIYAKPASSDSAGSISVFPVYTDSEGNQTEGPQLETVSDGTNSDFSNIDHDGKYRILLTNLQTPTDVFDLKIVKSDLTNSGVDFDYIVDPSSGPLSPGTMADNASVGTQAWDYPDDAKVGEGNSTSASIGAGGCFLAGTKITTGDGSYKNIEEIKVGEIVRSYDTEKKEIVSAPVIEVFHHFAEEMTGDYYLIITTENNHTIEVTVNHPVWANENWVYAGNLNVGDTLTDDNGISDKITEIEKIYEKVPTYNLEVDTYHTYFAGKILVHNKPGAYWTNVKLVKGGTIQGNNNATGSLPTGMDYVSFGSSSDLWGLSLSRDDVNSSTFGFAISVTGYDYSPNYATHYLVATNFGFAIPAGATINGILVEARARENIMGPIALIDHMRVTVDYTEAASDPADSYWVGGTGSWSEASTHWALTSGGGATAGALPGATTNVHFDSSSGGGTATVNSAVSVATVVMDTGNTTAVTLGNTLATTGNFTVTAGTFDPVTYLTTIGGTFSVTGTIKVGASTFAGNYSATPTLNTGSTVEYSLGGTQTIATYTYSNLTTSGGSGTKSLAAATTVNGIVTIGTGTTLSTSGSNYNMTVGGNWTNAGTFTKGTGTVTFNATDIGHTINPGSSSFYNLTFNGAGGAWSPLTNTVTVTNDLTMTAGTFDTSNGTANVTVNGNVQGTAGIINMTTTNTFTQSIASNKNFGTTAGSTAWTFNNLTLSASSGTITTSTGGTGDITVNSVMAMSGSCPKFDAGNRTYHLMGSGTPFTTTGSTSDFTASTSTMSYENTTSANIIAASYYNLQTNPASGTPTYTLKKRRVLS